MTYTIQETVETVGWSKGVDTAPAELVKLAKEMAEKGEVSLFGIIHPADTSMPITWCVITANKKGQMEIAKRVTANS